MKMEFIFNIERTPVRTRAALTLIALLTLDSASRARAQERPYFITYTHHMEEPGALELAVNPVLGTQREGESFLAGWTEVEYGLKGWWTTEFYLDGQGTRHDSALLTGYRWENRFRLLLREHRVNPVLYVEYESLSGADKTLLEVVGHDTESDHAAPNLEATAEREHEVETKLILSSNFAGWNASLNAIGEKNLSHAPWEFGYSLGISRPLGLAARPEACTFCPENLALGVELYGGLGTRQQLGFGGTSHYLAPLLCWSLPSGLTLRFSPSFGLNGVSHRLLLRWGVAYEVPGFAERVGRMLGRTGR